MISILKPGKDSALPLSYWPISLLDAICKLFENIILARILRDISLRGLMRDEQFGFKLRHSTSPQLARLVERITRNFGEKTLTGTVFLDVAKAFDTVSIDGLLSKLKLLNFPSYNLLVPPASDVRSVLPDGFFISSKHARWGGLGWIDFPCPFQSLRQRHITLEPSRVSPLRGLLGSHSNVPQTDAARQLPGVLPQRPSTVVERIENRHKCFQEQRDDIPACRTALHSAPTSHTLRGTNQMSRNYSLYWGNLR